MNKGRGTTGVEERKGKSRELARNQKGMSKRKQGARKLGREGELGRR